MSRIPSGKSTAGSEPALPGRDRRLPAILTGGDLGAAAVMAAVSYLAAKFTAPTGPEHAALFLAASVGVIAAGNLADRLWDSTTAPALHMTRPALQTLSRYPYRLLGGGIAFTVVLLAARRAGLVPVRDIPVAEIFATGTVLAAAYHATADAWRARAGGRSRTGGDIQERNGK